MLFTSFPYFLASLLSGMKTTDALSESVVLSMLVVFIINYRTGLDDDVEIIPGNDSLLLFRTNCELYDVIPTSNRTLCSKYSNSQFADGY